MNLTACCLALLKQACAMCLHRRYESVVTKLYTGIQCYSCGMRFTASQTDVYADHLDWHYRQNRSEKDVSRKVTHRRWYYTLTVRTCTRPGVLSHAHTPLLPTQDLIIIIIITTQAHYVDSVHYLSSPPSASRPQDWIEFEEIADLEERAKSLFFEKVNEEVVQKTQEAAKEQEFQSVRATADVVGEVRRPFCCGNEDQPGETVLCV